jgi:hypothetical protein
MTLSGKIIAASIVWALAGLLSAPVANAAAAAGKITHLSGTLYVKKASGVLKTLSSKSVIEQGDTLVTGKGTYARIQFADDSEMSLGPETQLDIERFSFDEANPSDDHAAFNLVKGKVHSIGGQIGRRSPDQSQLRTALGTLGIGRANGIVEYAAPTKTASGGVYGHMMFAAADPAYTDYRSTMSDAQSEFASAPDLAPLHLAQNLPPTAGLAPGLYVHVIDGIINLSNKGGSQNFSAGQFGYTASFVQPPVIVPNNPGIQFSPPPAFSSSSASSSGGASGNKSKTVDCEVR